MKTEFKKRESEAIYRKYKRVLKIFAKKEILNELEIGFKKQKINYEKGQEIPFNSNKEVLYCLTIIEYIIIPLMLSVSSKLICDVIEEIFEKKQEPINIEINNNIFIINNLDDLGKLKKSLDNEYETKKN